MRLLVCSRLVYKTPLALLVALGVLPTHVPASLLAVVKVVDRWDEILPPDLRPFIFLSGC